MKWWADHMQVSGVNFLIPHSFNPRAPYDNDCPPYFYNGGFEPRWPLYRVWADYVARLSLMLTGGRHVCPVAILFSGNLGQVGKMIPPEGISTALQDAQLDCDWLPMDVFERDAVIKPRPAVAPATEEGGAEIQLHSELYRVLVVPPVEVIPYGTLAKVKKFFDKGGIVVGYGFLPSKSTTIGEGTAEIGTVRREIWGEDESQPGPNEVPSVTTVGNAAEGLAHLLRVRDAISEDLYQVVLASRREWDSSLALSDCVDRWLHVLHRQKAGRDVFLVANQNHKGGRGITRSASRRAASRNVGT